MLSKVTKTLFLCLLLALECKASEGNKASSEALVTRYMSVLNAIAGSNVLPKNEIKRELLLALMINYYYIKDNNKELSKNFKGIAKSVGRKVDGFDFKLELQSYLKLIDSLDDDSAVFRLRLDGFNEKTSRILLAISKNNNTDDILKWVSE